MLLPHLRQSSYASQFVTATRADEKAKAVQELQVSLRGADDEFDFKGDSLQKRLLNYFEAKLGLKNSDQLLQEAEAARKGVFGGMMRSHLLGLHPANREIAKLVEGYCEYDLSVLHKAVVAESFSEELKKPEIQNVISAKTLELRGEDLFRYVVARLDNQRLRATENGNPGKEFFNPSLLVAGAMWTFPQAPVWIMPSAGAINIINRLTCGKMSQNAFNDMVKKHELPRIPQRIWSAFVAIGRKDSECLLLRKELEAIMQVSIDDVRRGARARPVKVTKK